MTDAIRKKYEERLARYQAAIDLKVPDRIPISTGSNYLAEIYAGNTKQEFIFERVLPRAFNEFKERGSMRSYMAFLKGGIAAMRQGALTRQRGEILEKELGMPSPIAGYMLAPFDYLADGLRGLTGIMVDIFRQPDKVLEACDAIIPHIVNTALAFADPLRRYPIFMPLHRGCHPFLSPKQFDTFYWPSFKKAMMMLIDAGYTIRAYLEGDWGPNWDHFCEMPKGKILCDIDVQGDIFKAKEDLKGYQCIAGGMPDSMLILGSPDEVREMTKRLCETVGKDGGYIINGGCAIPYDTKPENYRAMIDAVLEYGRYKDSIDFEPRINPDPPEGWQPPAKGMITPWEVKREELGEIPGNEDLIRLGWETIEHIAFNWLWTWVW